MTTPRKNQGGKKTPKARDGVPVLYLRITAEHEKALQAFIATHRCPPERTTVGIMALEEFLQREGFWPPKPKG